MKSNTVMGHPELVFRTAWIEVLWKAMAKTGKGYHWPTMRRLPPKGAAHWREERRADKPGTTKVSRRLMLGQVPKLARFPAL